MRRPVSHSQLLHSLTSTLAITNVEVEVNYLQFCESSDQRRIFISLVNSLLSDDVDKDCVCVIKEQHSMM